MGANHAPCGGRAPARHLFTLPPRCLVGGRGGFGRLSASAFSFLFRPLSPRPPSPVGKGETLGYFMQGAAPLASPRLNPRGTGKWGRTTRPAGGLAPALQARRALAAPGGGACLLCCPPPLPLVYFLAPYPPAPLPRWGRGRLRLFLCKGLRPLHPCA